MITITITSINVIITIQLLFSPFFSSSFGPRGPTGTFNTAMESLGQEENVIKYALKLFDITFSFNIKLKKVIEK